MRHGFEMKVLGDLFCIDSCTVSRICITWINFLHHELQFLISHTTNLPCSFKYFPKTRAIIDCVEFFIQRPSIPSSQRITWSQYKHSNTLKGLFAISPRGTFIFVSRLYTGSISDRRLTQDCGFLDNIKPGDDVMADRGFVIRDFLAMKMATLNIPPFSHGKALTK